ncbi:uncharacterized protein PV09_08422 [Verruconis gallopava]|uniref:Uncharacterized protein n=1 Tax=Verruconis gallopava TaxID=253628 RepID=A0A0D2A198_9PEZI|nr:uncharacterized protein PV09_08422 [Verruconis gallopava]KIW00080.1 hypothetical protein PV09_08422 [Verruconis gallopava]
MEAKVERHFVVVSATNFVKTPNISIVRSAARRHVLQEKLEMESIQKKNNTLQTRFSIKEGQRTTRQINSKRASIPSNLIKFSLTDEKKKRPEVPRKGRNRKCGMEQQLMSLGDAKGSFSILQQPYSNILSKSQIAVIELADRYVDVWKWGQSREDVIRETMFDQGICHSFLAMVYHLWNQDIVRAVIHENATINYLNDQFESIRQKPNHMTEDEIRNTARSVSRLALIKVNHGDFAAATVHMNGLSTLLTLSRGFGELSPSNTLRGSVGSLVLSYMTLWNSVPESIQYPLGPMTNSAYADVKSLGFRIEESSVLFNDQLSTLISLPILDALRALNALCTATQTKEGETPQPVQNLAYESLRLGLRLVYVGKHRNIDDDLRTSQDDFEECLRLTMQLFIWSFTRNVPKTSPTMKTWHNQIQMFMSSEQLLEFLISIALTETGMEIVVWLLLVVGSTVSTYEDQAFYARLMQRLVPHSLTTGFRDIQEMCTQIAWLVSDRTAVAERFWMMCLVC